MQHVSIISEIESKNINKALMRIIGSWLCTINLINSLGIMYGDWFLEK